MRLNLVLLLAVLIFLPSQEIIARGDKVPVAILNLEAAGIDSSTAISLSNRLRAELLKTGEFDVMERNRMEEILTEQGFQQTGACNTDECIVEAGRLLGVTRMIAGSVGKVGSIYTITVRMIDVETGRIIISATEDSRGPIENVLTISLRKVAQKLSALAATAEKEFLGIGELQLNSKPAGARVFIDDQILPGITPLLLDSIKAGVHVVRMQKGLLAASRAVFIAPDEKTELTLKLTPAKGALKIITDPGDVEIFLDYKSRGKAPQKIDDLSVGSYYLKLSKKGYVDYTQIITIKENETTVVTAKLIPMSYLTITTNPPECNIEIDDSLIGKSPVISYKLKPGYHKIKISKKGFVSFEETRSLPKGELTTIEAKLNQEARIMVETNPAEAEVYINGVLRGLSPILITNLSAGAVNIKLKKKYYEEYVTQVQLIQGSTKNFKANLSPKMGKLLVQSIPSQAIVEIDGIKRGYTPLKIEEIEFGNHLLRVIKDGYQTYKQELRIENYFPEIIKVNFEIAKGILYLRKNIKDAQIFIDGKQLEEIPATGLVLNPGEYHIRATRPGYEKFSKTAIIKPNDGFLMDITLTKKSKKKAVLRSLIFPGWGQKYAEKHTRKIIFSTLEIWSLTGMIVSELIFEKRKRDYNSWYDKYVHAITEEDIVIYRDKMVAAYDNMDFANNIYKKFSIAALSIWVLNVMDSAILKPIRPEISTTQYGLSYSF